MLDWVDTGDCEGFVNMIMITMAIFGRYLPYNNPISGPNQHQNSHVTVALMVVCGNVDLIALGGAVEW